MQPTSNLTKIEHLATLFSVKLYIGLPSLKLFALIQKQYTLKSYGMQALF